MKIEFREGAPYFTCHNAWLGVIKEFLTGDGVTIAPPSDILHSIGHIDPNGLSLSLKSN